MKPPVNLVDLTFRKLEASARPLPFICDQQVINNWFERCSQADHARFYARVTTVHNGSDPAVIGFYAMAIQFEPQSWFSTYSFIRDLVFTDKKVPTIHLHWIAVESDRCGGGIGRIMLGKVIDDAFQIIDRGGAYALTLKFIDDRSKLIYAKKGFVPYGDENSNMMYLPAQTIIDIVTESGG